MWKGTVEEDVMSFLPSSWVRAIGLKVAKGWLQAAAIGKHGPGARSVYWGLVGKKTIIGFLLGALAVVAYLENMPGLAAIVASIGGAAFSLGLADKFLRGEATPFADSTAYRFLVSSAHNIGAVLVLAMGWVYGAECHELTVAGHLLTCHTMQAGLLGLAGLLVYTGILDQAWITSAPVPPEDREKLRRAANRDFLGLMVLSLLVMPACGSMAQLRVGGEPVKSPDAKVVLAWVCAGTPDRAAAYLGFPEFAWIGQGGRERYLTDGLMAKAAGDCPCPVTGCAK